MSEVERTRGKLTVIESHLFPSISYMLLQLKFPDFVVEIFENYQKSSYRNRYYIGTVHGPVRLSVPLEKGKHQQMPINQVKMDLRQNWKEVHWKSIQTAYGKSPFFEHYRDELRKRFEDEEPLLLNWSLDNMKLVRKWLGFDSEVKLTSNYKSDYDQDRVIDIRNKLKPNSAFEEEIWNKYSIEYEQVFSAQQGFMENLSILDLIFCKGPEASSLLKNAIREQEA